MPYGGREAGTFHLLPLESLLLPVPKANICAAKAFGSRLDSQQLCSPRSAAFACIIDLSSFVRTIRPTLPPPLMLNHSPWVCRVLFFTEEFPFLKCCTLSSYTHATPQPSFKPTFFSRLPSSLVVIFKSHCTSSLCVCNMLNVRAAVSRRSHRSTVSTVLRPQATHLRLT